MPSWCYFGYGIEIKEQDARKIGLAIAKDENLLYENDTFEWNKVQFHPAVLEPLDNSMVIFVGDYEDASDCLVHPIDLANLLRRHETARDLPVMDEFVRTFCAVDALPRWCVAKIYDA